MGITDIFDYPSLGINAIYNLNVSRHFVDYATLRNLQSLSVLPGYFETFTDFVLSAAEDFLASLSMLRSHSGYATRTLDLSCTWAFFALDVLSWLSSKFDSAFSNYESHPFSPQSQWYSYSAAQSLACCHHAYMFSLACRIYVTGSDDKFS